MLHGTGPVAVAEPLRLPSFTAELLTTAGVWLALLKPRVMSLVVFTGAIGLFIAPVRINPVLAIVAILCIAVGAGASGAINMWYDSDIDALMRRTQNRPIPAGKISGAGALTFGIILAVFSVLIMWVALNFVAASILAGSILFYVFIYTMWLKRSTPQNIVIGGAAGAFPPLIGWAAATGSVDWLPVLLFAIVFFWTPPHFWSLSLYASADYERAGVPMLPVVRGPRYTRFCILIYSLILLQVTLAPYAFGLMGPIYGATALVTGLAFVYSCWRVMFDDQDEDGVSLTNDVPARNAFKYSIIYLFVLFCACAVDRMV
jgi:protoheme IX farnesyltransferase